MKKKTYVLIGKMLDNTQLAEFPSESKFSLDQRKEWKATSYTDSVADETPYLDRLSALIISSVTLMCPVGPHDDPGLGIAVVRACNISKVGSVAVQCSQGHWAEYPCG